MLKYYQVGKFMLPTYSVMILVGVLVCNLILLGMQKSDSKKYGTFLHIEFYCGLGAFAGAKILTLWNDFEREGNFSLSWDDFMDAGYSYYGGLAGFFLTGCLFCKINRLDANEYSKDGIFLLPLLHFFWKIGCYLGGCCFGIKYSGLMAIVYPPGVNALSGVSVFPSPLIEAMVSFVITLILFLLRRSGKKIEYAGLFLLLYGITRFFLEFFRYHDNSTLFSDGHIYSLLCAGIGSYLCINHMRRNKNE